MAKHNLRTALLRYRMHPVRTQSEVADKMGVSLTHYCKLESGKKKVSLKTIQRYAAALMVPERILLYDGPISGAPIIYAPTATQSKKPKKRIGPVVSDSDISDTKPAIYIDWLSFLQAQAEAQSEAQSIIP